MRQLPPPRHHPMDPLGRPDNPADGTQEEGRLHRLDALPRARAHPQRRGPLDKRRAGRPEVRRAQREGRRRVRPSRALRPRGARQLPRANSKGGHRQGRQGCRGEPRRRRERDAQEAHARLRMVQRPAGGRRDPDGGVGKARGRRHGSALASPGALRRLSQRRDPEPLHFAADPTKGRRAVKLLTCAYVNRNQQPRPQSTEVRAGTSGNAARRYAPSSNLWNPSDGKARASLALSPPRPNRVHSSHCEKPSGF